MSSKSLEAIKGDYEAVAASNNRTGEGFYRIVLEFSGAGAKAFGKTRPGQFCQIDLSGVGLPKSKDVPDYLADAVKRCVLLRRPFSFVDISAKGEKTLVEILYRVVGPSSLRMMTLAAGDSVSVIGPLGNGFVIPKNKTTAVIVAGGMGAPPLLHLVKVLAKERPEMEIIAFLGAKTAKELPFDLKDFKAHQVESTIVTDDGSLGKKGFVTIYLEEWLKENRNRINKSVVFSCGPEAMLARVAEIAKKWDIDCQVSMERRMACGFGLCQSCAIECRSNETETIYKMCCKDGPVFDSKEVVFSAYEK